MNMPRLSGLYIETQIQGPALDDLWHKTQTPDQHQLWDLRFTEINYLPRPNPSQPQRFAYATRIGFGLTVHGEGETVANTTDPIGKRTSSLKFWSSDPKSLIQSGSGYWQYVPSETGVTFLTWYDYDTRFGALGRVIDRLAFRPLMGWATAWSFDRLRLWIERGIAPAASLRACLLHGLARLTLAFVWLYQGLVPKLIARHPDELRMLLDGGLAPAAAQSALTAIGLAEVGMALAVLFSWRKRWVLLVNILFMAAALLGVAMNSPAYLFAAFNPVVLNVCVVVLSLMGYVAAKDMPSAKRCKRTRETR
jgi:hypothetical protein